MTQFEVPINQRIWLKENIQYHYDVIALVFQKRDLRDMKEALHKLFFPSFSVDKSISSKHFELDEGFLLWISLINASYAIFKTPKDYKRRKLIVNDSKEYSFVSRSSLELDCFLNPYLVFKYIFKEHTYNDLYLNLGIFFNSYYSKRTILNSYSTYYLITDYFDLINLIDACWVINQRSLNM